MPIRCSGPVGPLDKPIFPKDEAREPFWLKSAAHVFKAAREIIDLMEICQKKDRLPQSTIVLFAIWTASFVALYAKHFPHMDTERHILDHGWNEEEALRGTFHHGPTGFTYQTLTKMSVWLNMASTYAGVLQQMNRYFDKIKTDCKQHSSPDQASGEGPQDLPLRQAGEGGALEEYRTLPLLKEFGTLHPNDPNPSHIQGFNDGRSSQSPALGEDRNGSATERPTARPAPIVSFTAINHTPSSLESGAASDMKSEAGGSQAHDEQCEQWNQHSAAAYRALSPPLSSSQAGTLLGPAITGALAMGHNEPQYEIDREESKRFNVTNDLGILTQNDAWIDDFFSMGSTGAGPMAPDAHTYPFIEQHRTFA